MSNPAAAATTASAAASAILFRDNDDKSLSPLCSCSAVEKIEIVGKIMAAEACTYVYD